MDIRISPPHPSLGLRVAIVGAVLAAGLGAEAGASLRPHALERSAPPSPQLMVVDQPRLMALEEAGAGWPGRRPG